MTERPEDVTPDHTQADPVDPDVTLERESGAGVESGAAVDPEPVVEPAADAAVESGAEVEVTVEPEPEPEPEPSVDSRDLLHDDDRPTDGISPVLSVLPAGTALPNLAWVADRASFAARARSWSTEVVDPLVPAGLPFVPDGSPFASPVPAGPPLAEPPGAPAAPPPPPGTHAHAAPPAESDAPTETLHPSAPLRAAHVAPSVVLASPAFAAPAVAAPLPGPLLGAARSATGLSSITGLRSATGLSSITGLRSATAPHVIRPPRSTPGAASDVRNGADEPPAGPRPHRRRRLAIVGLVAAALVVLGGLYVGVLWLWADRVPPGTTVAGVEIGGLQGPDAVNVLEDSLGAAATDPLPVAVGDNRTTLDPATAGLSFDATATVKSLTGFGLEPVRLWEQLFGADVAKPVSEVDLEALAGALGSVSEGLSTPPVDGTVSFVDGQPQSTAPADGVALDIDGSADLLAASWLTAARPIELATVVDTPSIGQVQLDRAVTELAVPLTEGPINVAVADQVAELPADVLTSAASFVPQDGELALQMDGALLVEAVLARTTNLLTPAADASFAFQNGAPVIVAGQPGTTLDPDALAGAVAQAVTTADRTAAAELVETDPAESTAELEALGITQAISEFSTPLTSEPRRTGNIINGASKINGTLIRPGEEFNLGDALGPLDAAHGYVQAGAIVNGEHTNAWGGGLSQMSTTTYNAAYFAGMELVEHHPHSEWFSRYPEGRESTIFTPEINLRWKNNTPYGALVQSWVEGGRVYVRIWSTPYWTVESTTSGRSGVTSPTTVYSQSPTCEAQSAGNSGFTVTVTRRVLLNGVENSTESWTVRYKPQNAIVCGPPPG